MELITNVVGLIIALGTVLGITGVSYSKLMSKIEHIREELTEKMVEREVRQLISDRIEPHKVTVLNLSAKIEDVRNQTRELNAKIDQIIQLLYKANLNGR